MELIEKNTQQVDYLCWMGFSVISGFYLIFPMFFYDAYHFSRLESTSLSTTYLMGLFFGTLTYARGAKYIINKWAFKARSPERWLLSLSGLLTGIVLMLTTRFHSPHSLAILLFLLGVFTSTFSTLNMAIMNSNTYADKSKVIHHAGKQRWFQNLGITILFLIFALWKGQHYNIFWVLASITLLMSLIEFSLSKWKVKSLKTTPSSSNKKIYSKKIIYFFSLTLLSLIIFMQIPNLFAYYLHDHYSIGYNFFSKLMLINEAIVILVQIPLSNSLISFLGGQKALFWGLWLIGVGIALPTYYHSMTFVILSIILWTLGEIMMFTAIRAYIMSFSTSSAGRNTSLSTTYYTIFYLSSLSAPLIIHFFDGLFSLATLLMALLFLSLLIGVSWLMINLDPIRAC